MLAERPFSAGLSFEIGQRPPPITHVLQHLRTHDQIEAPLAEPFCQLADVANHVNAGPCDDVHTDIFGGTVPLDKRPRGTVHVASADLQHTTTANRFGRQVLFRKGQTIMIAHQVPVKYR